MRANHHRLETWRQLQIRTRMALENLHNPLSIQRGARLLLGELRLGTRSKLSVERTKHGASVLFLPCSRRFA